MQEADQTIAKGIVHLLEENISQELYIPKEFNIDLSNTKDTLETIYNHPK